MTLEKAIEEAMALLEDESTDHELKARSAVDILTSALKANSSE